MQEKPVQLLPSSGLGKFFLLILYLIPLIALLWFVTRLSVNIPFGDQWDFISFFAKLYDGKANFSNFFNAHNEHRMFFPRIIFAILAFSTQWDIRYEICVSILLAIITFLAIFLISLRGARAGIIKPTSFHIINLMTCWLIFSWAQHENWLWGFQIAWFLVTACLTLTILTLCLDKISAKLRLLISTILCFVASFTMASGLLVWLAVIPSVVPIAGNKKAKLKRLLAWILLFSASLLVYFIGYQHTNPLRPDSDTAYIKSLPNAVYHFLVAIGTPVLGIRGDILIALLTGSVLIALFLGLGIYSLINSRSKFTYFAMPWLSLGLFSIMCAAITSYGRSGIGIAQASTPRYITVNLFILVSLIQIVPLFINLVTKRLNKALYLKLATIVTLAIFSAVTINSYASAFTQAKHEAKERERKVTCLELFYFLKNEALEECSNRKDEILELNRIGFRKSFKNIIFRSPNSLVDNKVNGYLEDFSVEDNFKKGKFTGKIIFQKKQSKNQLPTSVLLSLDDQKYFIAFSNLDLENINKNKDNKYELNWQVEMSLKHLINLNVQMNAQKIHAYLYYPNQRKLVRLNKEMLLSQVAVKFDDTDLRLLESGKVFNADNRGLEKRIGPDGNPVFLAHADTRVVISLPEGSQTLSIGYGILDGAWQEAKERGSTYDGVEFRVLAIYPEGKEEVLFSQWIDPHVNVSDRVEKTAEIDLKDISTKKIALETLRGPKQDSSWDWSYWSKVTLN